MINTENLFIANTFSWKVVYALVTIIITLLIVRLLHDAIDKLSEKVAKAQKIKLTPKEARHYTKPIKLLTSFIAGITLLIFLLNIFDLRASVMATLSAAGFMGIVVGFAAKDVLSNLVAGIMIFIDKPFQKVMFTLTIGARTPQVSKGIIYGCFTENSGVN